MMRLPSSIQRSEVGFNMTPMIDVVFLLIIFFLVSSHLARQETQMPIPLPSAGSGEAPTEDETPRVTINLLADGTVLVAGKEMSAEQLEHALAERLRREGDQLEVRLRGDRTTDYRFVEPVLLACAKSGVWNVNLAVLRPEDAGR